MRVKIFAKEMKSLKLFSVLLALLAMKFSTASEVEQLQRGADLTKKQLSKEQIENIARLMKPKILKDQGIDWKAILQIQKTTSIFRLRNNYPVILPGLTCTAFECCICYEARFVSLKPNCSHEICGVCVIKIFETDSLNDKCGLCRKSLSYSLDDYSANYHKISDLKTKEYHSASIISAAKNKIEILKFLAEEKVDLNQAMFNGTTPVFIAAQKGNTEIVKFLAAKKVDLNRARNDRVTPVMIAAQKGHTEIVKFLAGEKVHLNRATNRGVTPVSIAAQNGHTAIVKFLAEEKVDLDRAMNDGATPIWIAALKGYTEIVKILAQEKADLNLATNKGVTPVSIAALEGHTKIVKILAEEKVDLNRAANNGFTPIMIAAMKGHTEIAKILIQSNANVKKSFLSLAATKEIEQIIAEALEKN